MKEYIGSRFLQYGLNLMGINGDRSDNIVLPFQASRTRIAYWTLRANPLLRGLINLEFMSPEEYGTMSQHGVSDVPRALSENLYEMNRDFYGTEDRQVNYEEISQARGTSPFYRTRIPVLMISADTDSLALIDQQVALANRRQYRHVRLPKAGHVDIMAGTVGAQRVVSETLNFVRQVK